MLDCQVFQKRKLLADDSSTGASILPPLNSDTTAGSITPTFGTAPDGKKICPICKATLRDTNKAKRHFDSTNLGIVFVCEICRWESNRKDRIKEHLMKKHALASDTAKVIADRSQKS